MKILAIQIKIEFNMVKTASLSNKMKNKLDSKIIKYRIKDSNFLPSRFTNACAFKRNFVSSINSAKYFPLGRVCFYLSMPKDIFHSFS